MKTLLTTILLFTVLFAGAQTPQVNELDSIKRVNTAMRHILETISYSGRVKKKDMPAFLVFSRRYFEVINDLQAANEFNQIIKRHKRIHGKMWSAVQF